METVQQTIERWQNFLKEGRSMGEGEEDQHADASGYPLEQALELFASELSQGASDVADIVTLKLPQGEDVQRTLGEVAAMAAIRVGEDLDLTFLGGDEWETVHLDFLATNPMVSWVSGASEALNGISERLRPSGPGLLKELLARAGRAGRAVTVAPVNDHLRETYRQLGFRTEELVDPTLMFWLPTDADGVPNYAYER